MDSLIKLIRLEEDTFAYVCRDTDENNADIFKTELEEYIRKIKELVDSDFEAISDKKFFDLLSNIYDITLEEEDYLEMFSRLYNRDYSYATELKTDMIYKDRADEGHAKDYSWWQQLYQASYYVAIDSDCELDDNKVYTRDELLELSDKHSIVLMHENSDELDDLSGLSETEEYNPLRTADVRIESYSNNITQFALEHFDVFAQILREKYTRKVVIQDLINYMNLLVYDINQVINSAESKSKDYSGIGKLCKEWYLTSGVKEEVASLQRKLKENKN